MIVPDVNLLLYATITAYPQHAAARVWWEDTLNSSTEVALTSSAVFGFIRIATNPRLFTRPLSVEEAANRVAEWLDLPNVNFFGPGPRHLETAFALLRGVGTGGNLTTDVQLAALGIEYDAEMCSNDTDFARFPGVKWTNPLAVSRTDG